jgi:DNA-binding transcriptional ArsR family regulator
MDADSLARLMRALGSVERLRALALCARAPARVSDLAQTLGESEPTVSRMLKQLAEAGVLRRHRRGQSVEYAMVEAVSAGGRIAALVVQQLGDADPVIRRAGVELEAIVREARSDGRPGHAFEASRLGRALRAALLPDLRQQRPGRVVLAACRWGEVVEACRSASEQVTLLAGSVAERTRLRRACLEAGLAVEVELAGSAAARSGSADWSFAAVEPGAADALQALEHAADHGRRRLRAGGSLWLCTDYDALDTGGIAAAAPPARLRTLVDRAGLALHAVLPVEADGRHLLLAHATVPARAATVARRA